MSLKRPHLMYQVLFLHVLFLQVFVLGSSAAMAEDSLCFIGEMETFSCAIKKKTVSVCETNAHQFIYRYGTRDQIDLGLASNLNFSTAMYSGGSEGRLTFNNGSYDYVVFSAMYSLGPATSDKDVKAGIIVVNEGKEVNRLLCTAPNYQNFTFSPESSKKISKQDNSSQFIDY